MSEATIWGLHAGRTGDADALFLKKNLIAVGWSALGDLSKIEPSRGPLENAWKTPGKRSR
jgi:restriction system protein